MTAIGSGLTALTGAAIFDGTALRSGHSLLVRDARTVEAIVPDTARPGDAERIDLGGGILAPGFVDLQVNGGGGVMLGDAPGVETLRTIAAAHARLGATAILPTLITDTPARTAAAIAATEAAIAAGVPGLLGLHLEGPHLCVARKGAHDAALIRPMNDADLDLLRDAAARLPALKVTLAPEAVTPAQIAALDGCGILVSLGHTDAGFDTCIAAAEAGARCVTHLFNAMSQMTARAPGLVGAALHDGRLSAGLIADGIHLHPAPLAAALRAKTGPGRVFLVSDAMATAGSDIANFRLGGREIRRSGDRLTLTDGTLAGAHLELATALRTLTDAAGLPRAEALAMATSIPATLIGAPPGTGTLSPGAPFTAVHLSDRLHLSAIWQGGVPLAPFARQSC